jgi:hypothetical protein
VNPATDCERVRLELMAALDGETVPGVADPRMDARQHLAFCSACGRWLKDLEAMNSEFHRVSYPGARVDLWAAVEDRIRQSHTELPVTHRLWLIGAFVLAWRALQLLTDLPFPMLHPFVPLAAAVAALWQIARDPLAIETVAPELQKRGI